MISTRQAAAIVVVAAFGVLGMSSAGLATANDGPPGQGPCNHGNSGKECKPDPQPDHGEECEEHGPNEGGVNEDHCAVDTTETTETTVDTTTGTTETTTSVPPTVETTTTPDLSGCPDGSPGTAGKDGEPGNDNCAAITTGVATTGTPTTTSDVETPPSTPSALTPPVGQRETTITPAARHGVLGAIFVAARARHESAAKAKGVHVLPFTP